MELNHLPVSERNEHLDNIAKSAAWAAIRARRWWDFYPVQFEEVFMAARAAAIEFYENAAWDRWRAAYEAAGKTARHERVRGFKTGEVTDCSFVELDPKRDTLQPDDACHHDRFRKALRVGRHMRRFRPTKTGCQRGMPKKKKSHRKLTRVLIRSALGESLEIAMIKEGYSLKCRTLSITPAYSILVRNLRALGVPVSDDWKIKGNTFTARLKRLLAQEVQV